MHEGAPSVLKVVGEENDRGRESGETGVEWSRSSFFPYQQFHQLILREVRLKKYSTPYIQDYMLKKTLWHVYTTQDFTAIPTRSLGISFGMLRIYMTTCINDYNMQQTTRSKLLPQEKCVKKAEGSAA